MASCGSGSTTSSESSPNSVVAPSAPLYKLSPGADTILSVYNALVTGKGCNYAGTGTMIKATTMPLYCYAVDKKYWLGNNPDTPLTIGITLADTFFSIALETFYDWSNCEPAQVHFPIDTITCPPCNDGSQATWVVTQKDYQEFVRSINMVDSVRDFRFLFRHGLKVIAAKNITRIMSWGIEDTHGFCATQIAKWYNSIYCAAGVTLKVSLRGSGATDSIVDCYLIDRDYDHTLIWKDSVSARGGYSRNQ